MAREWSLEGSAMKRFSLVLGVASVAAMVAALWSLPAAASDIGGSGISAARQSHDRMMIYRNRDTGDPDNDGDGPSATSTDVPEPGTLALLALGLSGIGVAAAKRRRTRT
jgi:hypothetical protein